MRAQISPTPAASMCYAALFAAALLGFWLIFRAVLPGDQQADLPERMPDATPQPHFPSNSRLPRLGSNDDGGLAPVQLIPFVRSVRALRTQPGVNQASSSYVRRALP